MYKTTREQANLLQEHVALHIPCDRSYLSRIETGKITPEPHTLRRIAEICGSPELEAWYCYAECAIGQEICNRVQKIPLTAAVLEIQHALIGVQDLSLLIKIARDGIITPDEIPDAEEKTKALLILGKAIDLFKLAISDAVDVKRLVREINEKTGPRREANSPV